MSGQDYMGRPPEIVAAGTGPAPRPSPSHGDGRAVWLVLLAAIAVVVLWALRSVVILVAFAVILAYALDPLVGAIERIRFPRGYRLPRPAAAAAVMLAIVIGGAWLASWVAPRLVSELAQFVRGIPANAERLLLETRVWATEQGMNSYVDPAIQAVRGQLSSWLEGLGGSVIGGIGRLFGTLGQILGLVVLPLLSYYLLAEREEVKRSVLSFVPESGHLRFHSTLQAVDRALKSYVRGQALVSIIMGTTVAAALAMLGFPAVVLLGTIVAFAEVLPYVGFLIAAVAIALTGYGIDLWHAVLGVGAYAGINLLNSFIVTPRVMGRHLKMHPFVVTVSVLAGAELLGPAGAMLALPVSAVLQSLAEQYAPSRRLVTPPTLSHDDLAPGNA